jgi:hypothetical protein
MRQPEALFSIALAAAILVPGPAAQAARVPIKACQTISQPGSYVLENDLTSTGDCLVITANFVTINLAGFSISSGGTAISASSTSSVDGIAIQNGSISARLSGVILAGRDLVGGDGNIVENLRIFSLGDGIRAKGIVRGNTVVGGAPTAVGIIASGIINNNYVTEFPKGGGITATGVVRGNIATGNGSGIQVGSGSTASGNTASDSGPGAGITAICPSNLTDNTAVNNIGGNLALIGDGCHSEDNLAP